MRFKPNTRYRLGRKWRKIASEPSRSNPDGRTYDFAMTGDKASGSTAEVHLCDRDGVRHPAHKDGRADTIITVLRSEDVWPLTDSWIRLTEGSVYEMLGIDGDSANPYTKRLRWVKLADDCGLNPDDHVEASPGTAPGDLDFRVSATLFLRALN